MRRLFFLFCLIGNLSLAQTSDFIRSGRPGNASGAFSAGKNFLQIENGTFAYSDFSSRGFVGNSFYMRYGISEKFEVNLITDLSYINQGNQLSYGGPYLGVKYNWLDNRADKISFGTILAHNFGSFYDDALNETSLNNIFVLNATQKLGICLNSIVIYSGESKSFSTWVVFNVGYSLLKDNTIYVEVSEHFSSQNATLVRLGWYKRISNDFQIDASVRLDQVDSSFPARFYPGFSIGFAKRFKLGK